MGEAYLDYSHQQLIIESNFIFYGAAAEGILAEQLRDAPREEDPRDLLRHPPGDGHAFALYDREHLLGRERSVVVGSSRIGHGYFVSQSSWPKQRLCS